MQDMPATCHELRGLTPYVCAFEETSLQLWWLHRILELNICSQMASTLFAGTSVLQGRTGEDAGRTVLKALVPCQNRKRLPNLGS